MSNPFCILKCFSLFVCLFFFVTSLHFLSCQYINELLVICNQICLCFRIVSISCSNFYHLLMKKPNNVNKCTRCKVLTHFNGAICFMLSYLVKNIYIHKMYIHLHTLNSLCLVRRMCLFVFFHSHIISQFNGTMGNGAKENVDLC